MPSFQPGLSAFLCAAAAQLFILSEENLFISVASWFQFMESQQEDGISVEADCSFLP